MSNQQSSKPCAILLVEDDYGDVHLWQETI